MIDLIEVRTSQGALLGLPLDDVSNGIVVEEVGGLDPVKANLVSSGFAQMDGEEYQSSKRDPRDVTLKLGIEPDWSTDTVRAIRQRLYGFFMPKSEVELRFYMTDGLVVNITGRVETFESVLFSAEPTVDISVRCFDPDFYENDVETVTGSTVSTEATTTVSYSGTVETGLKFTLNVNRTMGAFSIYLQEPDGKTMQQMDFAASLVAGDVITIVTTPGSKGVTKTQSGQDGSILYAVSPQSDWLKLFPGDSQLRVYAEGAAVPFTIEYTNKYGGL